MLRWKSCHILENKKVSDWIKWFNCGEPGVPVMTIFGWVRWAGPGKLMMVLRSRSRNQRVATDPDRDCRLISWVKEQEFDDEQSDSLVQSLSRLSSDLLGEILSSFRTIEVSHTPHHINISNESMTRVVLRLNFIIAYEPTIDPLLKCRSLWQWLDLPLNTSYMLHAPWPVSESQPMSSISSVLSHSKIKIKVRAYSRRSSFRKGRHRMSHNWLKVVHHPYTC